MDNLLNMDAYKCFEKEEINQFFYEFLAFDIDVVVLGFAVCVLLDSLCTGWLTRNRDCFILQIRLILGIIPDSDKWSFVPNKKIQSQLVIAPADGRNCEADGWPSVAVGDRPTFLHAGLEDPVCLSRLNLWQADRPVHRDQLHTVRVTLARIDYCVLYIVNWKVKPACFCLGWRA